MNVAPLAGAWIEIIELGEPEQVATSLPLRERGLKLFRFLGESPRLLIVAPLAGAWIEISMISSTSPSFRSLPLRERGLK